MAELLETVMTAVFDIALLFLVIYSAKGRATNGGTRLVALTFSVGFLLGILSKCIAGGGYAVMTLSALGLMLSYMLFVFSIPERKAEENRTTYGFAHRISPSALHSFWKYRIFPKRVFL